MLMKFRRYHILLFILFILSSCLEPYNATVGNQSTSLLVVDGLISNEDAPHFVKLTRTLSNIDQEVVSETGAFVAFEDQNGIQYQLTETDDGVYRIEPDVFRGISGNSYHVYIKTKNGERYSSEPIVLPEPTEIDDVYYIPDNNGVGESVGKYNGLGIYVSGHTNSDDVNYLRWSYEEDWKFQVPFSPIEIPNPDNSWSPAVRKKYCYKSSVSSEIQIQSFKNQSSKEVLGKELYFILSEETDKLLLRYSTNIKQYSISKEEYDFWNKLDQTNPGETNIFGEQPFTISGNIKNVDNPDETVLGFFQVAGCTTKRIYIDYSEIRDLRLPMKDEYLSCGYDSLMLEELNVGSDPNDPAFENIFAIYDHYVLSGDYNYDLAFEITQGPLSLTVIGLALSTKQCTDCTLVGKLEPPAFWIDD